MLSQVEEKLKLTFIPTSLRLRSFCPSQIT